MPNPERKKTRRRHRRYKAPSKREKRCREARFTENHEFDFKTGLSHGEHDFCRIGLYGPLNYATQSPKWSSKNTISRCPLGCPICHGREPGCLGGERTERKFRQYQQSIAHAEEQLKQENNQYFRYISYFRTLGFLSYLRTFTFSFENPRRVFFSLYDQSVTVQMNPRYPKKWVAFQNKMDSSPFLTWKREKRCLVISPKQKKVFVCTGAITRFLVMRLFAPPPLYGGGATNRLRYARYQVLRLLFGKKSICRLIKAGGLNLTDYTYQCCSESYFGI